MKIISKFHDYYDGASGLYDPVPLYVRETKQEYLKKMDRDVVEALEEAVDLRNDMPTLSRPFSARQSGIIFFCGQCYPFYFVFEEYCFSIERIIKLYENMEKAAVGLEKKEYANILKNLNKERVSSFSRVANWLDKGSWKQSVPEGRKIHDKAFIKLGAPVFVLYRDCWGDIQLTINPMLKNYNFASLVDPYTAYQEISMYLGNQLAVKMNPNIKRTDNDIRDSKGFDGWSFRRHKKDPR